MLSRAVLVALLGWTGVSMAAESGPLDAAPSAFVRAQARSGIQWHRWDDAALAAARQSGRSVYVFVGSPLSELTRATVSQTFGSAKTIEWLNASFFCIFVDADHQPDLSAFGQHYLRSVKQVQGFPAHLWFTPDLQIYDGANYLPPSEEWGKAGFLKSARTALDTWNLDHNRALALAKEAREMMGVPRLPAGAAPDAAAKLTAATTAWVGAVDAANGGFGSAPKLPEPELIRFLLGRGDAARAAALGAARALVSGAAHDHAEGGFFRRCIDEAWKEPYFQKTLNDQARIALALFDAADAGDDPALRAAAVKALEFSVARLGNPDGSFAAALDGTLEENPDPAQRPKFAKVGNASVAAESLLAVALQRSGESRLVAAAAAIGAKLRAAGDQVPHAFGLAAPATAADLLAGALALRALKDEPGATRLIAAANERFFDEGTGAYQASARPLPAGIDVRAPASGDLPSPETLALMGGVKPEQAARIRQALLAGIEYDDQPAGDVLLALGQK